MESQVKAALEATVDALTLNPGAAQVRQAVESELLEACEVRVRIGDWTVSVDEPPALGGSNQAPSPTQYALAALGSCQAVMYRLWAERLGLQVERLEVRVRGDLDVRGLLGLADEARSGFRSVEVEVAIDSPEPPQRLAELRRAVDRHCPVLDVFVAPVPVSTTLRMD